MVTKKLDLIDRNALYEKAYFHGKRPDTGCLYTDGKEAVDVDDIDDAPSIDAVEVVHGWWKWYIDRCEDLFLGCDDDYGWRCSLCQTSLDEDDPTNPPTFPYCPNCGAKMDLEVDV